MTMVCRIKRLHGASQGFYFVTQRVNVSSALLASATGSTSQGSQIVWVYCTIQVILVKVIEYNLHGGGKCLFPGFVVDGK